MKTDWTMRVGHYNGLEIANVYDGLKEMGYDIRNMASLKCWSHIVCNDVGIITGINSSGINKISFADLRIRNSDAKRAVVNQPSDAKIAFDLVDIFSDVDVSACKPDKTLPQIGDLVEFVVGCDTHYGKIDAVMVGDRDA